MDTRMTNPPMQVPIIGQPMLIGAVTTVGMRCNCVEHVALMGVAGGGPIECPACKTRWMVGAEVKLQIGQMGAATPIAKDVQ